MKLVIDHSQRHKFSINLQKEMKILQMNSTELNEFLTDVYNENPFLEFETAKNGDLSLSSVSLPAYPAGSRKAERGDSAEAQELRPMQDQQSFESYVKDQIIFGNYPEKLRRQLMWLCYELDDRGYLPKDPGNLSVFDDSIQNYEKALEAFQALEPAGIGARSLGECLELQLARKGLLTENMKTICDFYLQRLASGQLNYISKQMKLSVSALEQAKRQISMLEPCPSNGFYTGEGMEYVLPDVEIVRDGDRLKAALCSRNIPECRINSYYLQMASDEKLNTEEREYFKTKLSQANWIIECICRRKNMVLSCAEKILEMQYAFFDTGKAALEPCSMIEMARLLSVHPSTISRTVRGKTICCINGIFPFTYFLNGKVNSESIGTGEELRNELIRIIQSEDPANPLSDSKISELLSIKGFPVSRRTVAKYREAAGISSSASRRLR